MRDNVVRDYERVKAGGLGGGGSWDWDWKWEERIIGRDKKGS